MLVTIHFDVPESRYPDDRGKRPTTGNLHPYDSAAQTLASVLAQGRGHALARNRQRGKGITISAAGISGQLKVQMNSKTPWSGGESCNIHVGAVGNVLHGKAKAAMLTNIRTEEQIPE